MARCSCGIKDCRPSAGVTPSDTGNVTWLKTKYGRNVSGQGFKRASRAGNGTKKRQHPKGGVWPGMNIGYKVRPIGARKGSGRR